MAAVLMPSDSANSNPGPSRQTGFTMVLLVWALALMAIMMGVAVQSVSFQMQREKETELIFRGEQYVEAIRLYKKRFGRNPMKLKELWEAKPRVIRQKWKDPMTGSEQWGLIFMGQQGRNLTNPRNTGGGLSRPTPTPTPRPQRGEGTAIGRQPERVGPIIGVHSTSCEESIRTYEGRNTYCEWKFQLKEGREGQGGRPNPNQPPNNPNKPPT